MQLSRKKYLTICSTLQSVKRDRAAGLVGREPSGLRCQKNSQEKKMHHFKFIATVLVVALAAIWLANNVSVIGRVVGQ